MCDNADYFHGHIDNHLKLLGLVSNSEGEPLQSKSLVDIIEGYKGKGYGLSTSDELGQSIVNCVLTDDLSLVAS